MQATMPAIKHTPATPLPWHTAANVGSPTAVELGVSQTLWLNEAEDAAYIVHAANAYPKLIEALRKIDVLTETLPVRKLGGAVGQALDEAQTLLRELGEAS